jgi:hypothetical protein
MAEGSWMAWTVAGIAGIWLAVLLISIFSPDLITDQQEQVPVAAFGAWFWGVVATGLFLWAMGRLRGSASRQPIWIGLAVATLVVWLVATILAITLPDFESATEPTRVPVGAVFSPPAAAALTGLAGVTA